MGIKKSPTGDNITKGTEEFIIRTQASSSLRGCAQRFEPGLLAMVLCTGTY